MRTKQFNMTIYPDAPESPEPAAAPLDPSSRARRTIWLAAAWFLLLTVVMVMPLSLSMANHVRDPGDPLLDCWILSWETRTLLSHPSQLYDTNAFYPFRYSLAYSETMFGQLLVYAPLYLLTGNAVLAHNTVLLLAFFLSGLGAFALVKYLTGSAPAAVIAGTIFAFAPYKFAHLSHLNLLSTQWIPFTMLFLHRGVANGRRRDFVGFAVCFAMQALSSFYYGIFFACAVALYVLYMTARRRMSFGALVKLSVACAFVAAVVVPTSVPYFVAQQEYGFSRDIEEVHHGSASATDYVAAPQNNLLYGAATARWRTPGAERILFPGVLPVLLAIVGLLAFGRRSASPAQVVDPGAIAIAPSPPSERVFYVLLALCAFVLSFGPHLRWSGQMTDIRMPYLLLYNFVPGVKGLRVPARFDILVTLSLTVLSGYGVAWLWNRFRLGKRFAVALVMALVLTEYATYDQAVPVRLSENLPQVYRWLSKQPAETVLAEIPATTAENNATYQYFSTYHWLRIVNGYSGFWPTEYNEVARAMAAVPDADAIELLRALNVRYLIFHRGNYPVERRAKVQSALDGSAQLKLVQDFDNDRVYELPPPGPMAPLESQIWLPRKIVHEDPFYVHLQVTNTGPNGKVIASGRRFTGHVSWDDGPPVDIKGEFPFRIPGAQSAECAAEVTPPHGATGMHKLKVEIPAMAGSARVVAESQVDLVESMPDSYDNIGHHAVLLSNTMPTHVRAGSTFTFQCIVRNDGDSIWLPQWNHEHGVVGVRLRSWHDRDGHEVLDAKGVPPEGRGMLENPVWPGQVIVVPIHAFAPPKPGEYVTKIDIVSEWVTWFGDIGAFEPQEIKVVVE